MKEVRRKIGKDIGLNKDIAESNEISELSFIEIFKGNGDTAILKVKSDDEAGFYTGTLEIINDKVKVTFKVYGEIGC